jgi:2-polyprenyl-3-methyl-5-hydroxy-6-metoxy-1,4-benzoquinol methylase
MECRFCQSELKVIFADLGMSPLANSYLKEEQLDKMEPFYPLCSFVCEKCLLVQLDEFESPKNIFSDYAYFSSFSESWVKHVEDFSKMAIERFNLNKKHKVIEIASNDGYLLQHFKKKNISVLGIDPAVNVGKVAIGKGIPTIPKFFGIKTAKEIVDNGNQADLLIAINVLPHTPELIDFIKGAKILLKNNGTMVIQFSAYLLQLIENNEFDMIYHEHFSYFSLHTLKKILSKFGLEIFDVKEVPVHGGSLRIFIKHEKENVEPINKNVKDQLEKEQIYGLDKISTYVDFSKKIEHVKSKLWEFFITAKKENKKVICYGAAAKGNTLLNYCGVGKDFVEYSVDISPHKQGLYLPGTHIPIYSPEKIRETKPDYILLLAWNLKDEIMKQLDFVKEWGGKFVVPIPEVEILDENS